MLDNKFEKFLIPGAIILGFIVLTVGVILAISACSFQIGIVDTNRVQNTKFSQKIIFEKQIETQRLQEKFKNAKTDAEKGSIQAEYQQFVAKKDQESSQKLREIIKKVALQKGIKSVASSQVFPYSTTDITDDVVKELDK
jgi:hypothetical protein